MISLADVLHVLIATVPLYVAMILAYVSIKWWKLFTPVQCSGINKFVAKFSIPLLSFQVISSNNPYKMNVKLVCADFLQKFLVFLLMAAFSKLISRGKSSGKSLNWVILGLSLSTLPNTLILGIPLLRSMYGDEAAVLLSQIVVLQSLVWYNLLLFLFELNAAKQAFLAPPLETTGEVEASQEEEGPHLKDEAEELKTKATWTKEMLTVLQTVGRKLLTNPNTHGTVAGLIWASIHFRWELQLPSIVDKSITILSNGGLGMAMFSLGLFMASQASIIACGARMAVVAMGMKFLVGPGLMAVPCTALGLRGTLFRVAIVQATLPQGIVPFVFAKEYNVHPDILSTGVIFGLLIAMPIALAYYFLLAL